MPSTKTHANRAIKYTPACHGIGVVELTDSRSHTRYAVAVQPFGGVRLTKSDGETYVVVPGSCECAGFVFGKGKPCKHLTAVETLIGNGWLEQDERETVTDRDADVQEREAYYGGRLAYEPLPA